MSVTREYSCSDCDFSIIDNVSIKEPIRGKCPECGKELRQNYGKTTFMFFSDPRHGMTGHRLKATRGG